MFEGMPMSIVHCPFIYFRSANLTRCTNIIAMQYVLQSNLALTQW